jgi:hypothetical protein
VLRHPIRPAAYPCHPSLPEPPERRRAVAIDGGAVNADVAQFSVIEAREDSLRTAVSIPGNDMPDQSSRQVSKICPGMRSMLLGQ